MIRPALPRWVAFPAGIAAVFLTLPLLAMLLRVPWLKVPALLTTPASLDALSLSLRTCLLTTALRGSDNTHIFQLIKQARSTRITDPQTALNP